MAEKKKTAIVVGAGVGGVATAARLAKAGFDVTVVEKNGFTGGRCSLIHNEAYRFDQGPALILFPKLFKETFHDLDTSLEAEGIELLKCEPNYSLWFGDGESFQLSTDISIMKREIEKWEGKAGFERYLAWMREAHRHYELSVTHVLHKNFTKILDMVRPAFVGHILELHPFESIYSRASKYFWTDRLRRVFTFGSMYMGMSPFDAPGTYSLLQYTELAEGIWYPVGGFHKIVEKLVDIGERMGVTYRLNTPVKSIITSQDSKIAKGVLLESNEKLYADIVVINADLVYAYNNLLPPTPSSIPFKSYADSLSQRTGSCSSISFYWSLSQTIPELKVHNIFLADEYRESFDSVFERQSIPIEHTFYVNVPSRIDPTAAPEGCDSVSVLVPIGHLPTSHTTAQQSTGKTSSQDWERSVSSARDQVLRTIESRTGAQLAPHIKHESINTPLSWQSSFNLDKGCILGLAHSFFNVLAFRPTTKHAVVRNCYFVGASTYPGGGVAVVLAGAKITAEQILGDGGLRVPWGGWEDVVGDMGRRGKGVGSLDLLRARPVLSSVHVALLLWLVLTVMAVFFRGDKGLFWEGLCSRV